MEWKPIVELGRVAGLDKIVAFHITRAALALGLVAITTSSPLQPTLDLLLDRLIICLGVAPKKRRQLLRVRRVPCSE